MGYTINRAMVIGAGVMGAGIAAHLANADVPVYLVDIVPPRLNPEEEKKRLTLESPQVRNRIAQQGLEFIKRSQPPSLFSPTKLDLIRTGNMEDDFDWAHEVDWIIEAVIEDLDIKRHILARIDATRQKDSIVSTNTSGIPIHEIAKGCSAGFKSHFLGTHFFNPARYMKLLEFIPTGDTDSRVLRFMEAFGERRLGKTVVLCKDTPNFIANRVAVVTGKADLNYALEKGYTVEEIDAITGPLIGHPKTATFRLFDLVGMDVDQRVSSNLYEAIPHDRFRETLHGTGSALTKKMVEKGLLGSKAGKGFYRKTKGPDGKNTYQVLDLNTLEYRDQQEPEIPLVKEAGKIKPLGERLRFLVEQGDRFSKYFWRSVAFSLSYCSHLVPEVSDTFHAIDDAIKAGFSHEMGPFEIWDALGVKETAARMEADGFPPAPWVQEMIKKGGNSFYGQEKNRRLFWNQVTKSYQPVSLDPHVLILADRKREAGVIEENPSASLIDLGEGVLCLEFHSKANAIDQGTQAICDCALEKLEEDFTGLVIGNQGKDFSVGANVVAILAAAEDGQWDLVEKALKKMQDQMMSLRYFPKPVVAAPFGMTLGGGAEITMAADRICASAETYMGLSEVGVGLIPAGGGCLEMIKRVVSPPMRVASTDALPFLQKVFETIAMAKVSQSAFHAKEMGFLKESDRWVMNGRHLLKEAKSMVLEMHRVGYVPPVRTKSVFVLGERGLAYLMQAALTMRWGGYITDYDHFIAKKLAYVLAGGALSAPQWVDEEYVLDLEREVFLSLLGQTKTIDRIKHMLTTGKPLRN